jgi:hypothetical protein
MRTHWKPIALAAAIVAGLAAIAADGLAPIGLPPEATREAIGTIITYGVNNPGLPTKAFKALPPAARAQAVTSAAGWVKAYTLTPEFKAQYEKLRQTRKPEAPPAWTTTPEQELQKADDEQKKQLEESKKQLANLPPETRKAVEQGMQAAAAMTAQMNTPEMRKLRLDGIKSERAQQTKSYQDSVAKWNQDYPADPKPVIVKRLKEFLALSADVDYSAKLNGQGSAATFVNPGYQSKPSQWKMCYRAGKEATDAGRAAAQAWLKELGG